MIELCIAEGLLKSRLSKSSGRESPGLGPFICGEGRGWLGMIARGASSNLGRPTSISNAIESALAEMPF